MAQQTVPEIVIALVLHMDAGDRDTWTGAQDERPLSDLGRKQAAALAKEFGGWKDVIALYASPALRARETLEPLAKQFSLEVKTIASLSERRSGESDAAMAQRGEQALDQIVSSFHRGVIIAASHGDIVPSTISRLASRRRLRVPVIDSRNEWYALLYGADLSLAIELHEIANFPQK
jgi:broad specificity phosphatase PhoE